MEDERSIRAKTFLQQAQTESRGKLKIYIGMSAGVGKTYRMLQEAHDMLLNGVNVKIGFVETHGRKETLAALEGLPCIPRREVFYKGKLLQELDVNAVLILHPDWVIIDELAHTNIPGSKNEKRWQDVVDVLNAGINVITAVNIQHIESINDEVRKITGIDVKERVPDKFLQMANEVVNIDLTADELINRLRQGKIYDQSKIQQALTNFFQPEKILQLRELALKEVATQVERKVETEVTRPHQLRHERFLACISSNEEIARKIIRKTARLSNYYHSDWFLLYVQTPKESAAKIPLATQRHLINNFKTATELGAEVIQIQANTAHTASIVKVIADTVQEKNITTICIGKPHFNLWERLFGTSLFNQLLKAFSDKDIDIIILS
ncbi:MAG: sensor protein KdpD [Saprospiraceae bacterium]|nr:sensor protein KdpD [Saprospiraceae bacterium]